LFAVGIELIAIEMRVGIDEHEVCVGTGTLASLP
jgi:hypothetical protein